MAIFIEYPILAAAIGIVLLGLGRLDLLVMYPALLIGLVAGGVSLFRAPAGTRRPA